MEFSNQAELAAYVSKRLTRQIDRAHETVAILDAAQREKKRQDGGWSIDEILAHMAQTSEAYLSQIEPLVGIASEGEDLAQPWKPTLGGKALRWTVNTRLKLKTPGIFRPERLEPGGDVLAHFERTQWRLLETAGRMRGASWEALRCSSPATSLLRLNLGDVFLILADHSERHVRQIEERGRTIPRSP